MLLIGCQGEEIIFSDSRPSLGQPPEKFIIEPSEIMKKGKELSLTESERVWTLISWTTSLQEATQISQETQRPISVLYAW